MNEATQEKQDSGQRQSSLEEASRPASAEVDMKEDTQYITGAKLTAAMASVSIVMLIAMIDLSIITTAIPQITSDFHRLEDIGWYVGAYMLASASLQPLSGKLYTYISTKWVYIVFLAVFEVGSLICAVATSSSMFIVGRSIAGIGCSGLANGSLTIIAGAVPLIKRPLYQGTMMGLGQIGVILGPLLGGLFTEYVTWRWCFYINLPLGGLAALLLILIHIPDQIAKQPLTWRLLRELIPRLDLPGFALFAPAAIMFLMALQLGAEATVGWGARRVIGLFSGAGVAAVLFVLWEHRVGDEAMIPGSIIRRRVVWASGLHFGLLSFATSCGSNFLPIYFQAVGGVSPTMSGVYMLASILSQLLFIVISGALVTKFGYYIPWAFFAGAGTTIGGGLMTTFTPWTSLGRKIGYQIVYGTRGAGLQMGIVAVQSALPPSQSAIGISVLVFCQNIMSSVFITVANTVFQTSLAREVVQLAPSISPAAAAAAGSSGEAVRALAPPGSELEGLLLAFSRAVGSTFYMVVASGIVVCAASLGMGWVDLRKKKEGEGGGAVMEKEKEKANGEGNDGAV